MLPGARLRCILHYSGPPPTLRPASAQIGAFMSDIADEFKIVVVEAVRTLCLKFPAKHRVLMNFLSTVLREDGGFEYKKAIVDAILALIREIPDAKDAGPEPPVRVHRGARLPAPAAKADVSVVCHVLCAVCERLQQPTGSR